jgi:transposase
METEAQIVQGIMLGGTDSPENTMLSKERWEEIRRLHEEQRLTVSEIGRRLEIDRKTVRKALREDWKPYARAVHGESLLHEHASYVEQRIAEVNYSAQVLYQELKGRRGFAGSYETVKRYIAPLRAQRESDRLCQTRFETGPGEQSQIDWGQVRTYLRNQPVKLHIFVLTLGYSRRSYYRVCANEQLGLFLESHEAAFEHFGGLTQTHLYDRPRTVCERIGRRWRWNETFRSFAAHWGFEPRLCASYRAQTKGKVESGVKYVKRNFMPGRQFIDIVDVQAQLDERTATIADQRIHGTTHQRPIDRFQNEHSALMPIAGHGSFGECRRVSRIVADDYLVSFQTNRYSVPFGLIGKTVEVMAVGEMIRIEYGSHVVAEHPRLGGKHEMRILPEHGPGATARNTRHRFGLSGGGKLDRWIGPDEVEVRDPSAYEEIVS